MCRDKQECMILTMLNHIGRFYILRIENYDKIILQQERKKQNPSVEFCDISSINSLDSSGSVNVNSFHSSSLTINNNRTKSWGGYNFKEEDHQKFKFSPSSSVDRSYNSTPNFLMVNSKFDVYLKIINTLLEDTPGHFKACVWSILWTSCLFMICLCWDMAGDHVGWKKALWVPCTGLCILPLIGYTHYLIEYYKCCQRIMKNNEDEFWNGNEIENQLKEDENENEFENENKIDSINKVERFNFKLNQVENRSSESSSQVISTIHSERGTFV